MPLELNHFYKCKDWHLLVYPSKEKAAATAGWEPANSTAAEYWSKELNCKVDYSEKNSIFLVLEIDEPSNEKNVFIKILFKDELGWAIFQHWMTLEEVNA